MSRAEILRESAREKALELSDLRAKLDAAPWDRHEEWMSAVEEIAECAADLIAIRREYEAQCQADVLAEVC